MKKYDIQISPLYNLSNKKKLKEILHLQNNPKAINYVLKNKKIYYNEFSIKQKNNKKREIQAPQDVLKFMQGKLNTLLLRIKTPDFLFSSKKSNIQNAEYHKGNTFFLSTDIEHFYQNVSEQKVYDMFNTIKGLEYYVFEASDLGVTWLNPCDWILLKDRNGNEYKSLYLKGNLTINTGISGNMSADVPSSKETEYKVTTEEMKKTLKVERLAKKNEGLIQDLITETSEYGERLTEITQDMDSINQRVSKIEDFSRNIESRRELHLSDTADGEGYVIDFSIKGKMEYLAPSDDLVPSHSLVPMGDHITIVSDKQSRLEESEDAVEYDVVPGPFPEGYGVLINMRDNYLILNDETNKPESIQKMKDLFKRYGINEKYINWWKNNSYSRQVQNYEEEKEDKKNIDKKNETKKVVIDEENIKSTKEKNKERFNTAIKNLQIQENNIRNNFKLTKRNFSNFRQSFTFLKSIIMSIDNLTYKIKNIYPYGSIAQLTQNSTSDYEISIITENYSNITNEQMIKLFNEIKSYIEINFKNDYKINKINSIRETKRTVLLLIFDIKNNINIEINCNNFFSIMNSNLIYTYLTYDARALILVNTIKDWSKIKGINSNHEGFMSSYCYTLMTIFFLQRIHKPLLPVISSNNYDKIKIKNKEYFIEKELLNPAKSFKNWKSVNTEDTITTLLLKWFIFYLYLFNEDDYCIDISNDKLTFRYYEAKYLNYFNDRNKISVYCILDMFDYTYNPGSYMDRNSTPHKLYIKKLEKSLVQLLNGEDYLFKPDYEIGEKQNESPSNPK